MERVAEQLVMVLRDNPNKHLVEHAEKRGGFKVKLSDPGKNIAQFYNSWFL